MLTAHNKGAVHELGYCNVWYVGDTFNPFFCIRHQLTVVIFIAGGVTVICVVHYAIRGRKVYKGPVVKIRRTL